MRWTERQQAMLREIGVRLWLPPEDVSDSAEGSEDDARMTRPSWPESPRPRSTGSRDAATVAHRRLRLGRAGGSDGRLHGVPVGGGAHPACLRG